MTKLCWHWAERTAGLLDHDECEAVLGDLQEAGEGAWHALLDVVGLLARRRLAVWKDWRPWVASLGLALPFSFLLMGFSLSVSHMYQRLSETAPGLLVLRWVCDVLLLTAWAWTGGYVMGSLSRRTIRVSVALACAPCFFCLARFRGESLSRFCLMLFLVPAIWGVVRGMRAVQIRLGMACTLAATITLFALPSWTRPGALVANLALSWPVCYLVAKAWRAQREPSPMSELF